MTTTFAHAFLGQWQVERIEGGFNSLKNAAEIDGTKAKGAASFGYYSGPIPHFMDADIHGTLPPLPDLPPKDTPGDQRCQLASQFRPNDFPILGAIVDEKVDGVRAIWHDGRNIWSRYGSSIISAEWLVPSLKALAERLGPGEWMIDGEITCGNDVQTAVDACRREVEVPEIRMTVFDAVPLRQYRSGAQTEVLHLRRDRLQRAMDKGPFPGLAMVRWIRAWNIPSARTFARKIWEEGGEGVVIKNRHSAYRRERNREWMKLKRTETVTIDVTGWEPLRKKQAGKWVEYPDQLGVLIGTLDGRTVRVAVGFSEDDRRRFARLGYDLPGRRAEIEGGDKTNSGALLRPRFIRWRYREEG